MAVIGKIRKRGGLITIIIGLALAAFVLGDFWKKSGNRGSKNTNVGVIAGEKVTNTDFEAKVTEQEELMKQQTGKENLTSAQLFQLREETWKTMTRDIILGIEYDDLGLVVSSDELWDLVQGKEPHQYILQNFADPQTGAFNPAQVRNFLQNLETYEQQKPGTKAQWANLEASIKSDRIYTKYMNLIKGGYYMPKAMAKMDYDQKNRKADFRFFADKYANIADTKVTVTQDDFQKYYDAHKQEYEQEASRDLEYVSFDVDPSEADLKKAKTDVNQIETDFAKQENKDVPTFVNRYSDVKYDSLYYKKGALPMNIDSLVFKAKKDELLKPIYDEATFTYTLAKVMDFQMRPDSMKASHILIAYAGSLKAPETVTRTKDRAKAIADSLLLVIKKDGKKFDTIAKKISDDPTAATKAGDLDWFADGAMVGPFNEACVEGKVGDLKVVETDFGFHIVKITGKKKLVNKARVAVITMKIEPSNETFQAKYSDASAFAGECTTMELFNKSVVDKKLNKKLAEYLTPMTDAIAGLDSPREIVRWAFEEATKKGDVSKVFDLQGKYVVACVKEVREKGIPTLDQIKTQLEPLVKREKKAETIIKKINAFKTAGISLDQLALKDSASVDTLDFITFSSYSIPGFGPEPDIIGTLFTLKTGVMSEPLKGKTGVFVVYVDKFVDAPATTDYTANQKQAVMTFKSRVGYDLYNALEKNAKVEDNRMLFY
jgi:peptidyl-prolyl cis-trans isomerase D